MTRQTVSIANAHDGVALTAEEATELAAAMIAGIRWWDERRLDRDRMGEIIAILRGKRRDGSETGDAA